MAATASSPPLTDRAAFFCGGPEVDAAAVLLADDARVDDVDAVFRIATICIIPVEGTERPCPSLSPSSPPQSRIGVKNDSTWGKRDAHRTTGRHMLSTSNNTSTGPNAVGPGMPLEACPAGHPNRTRRQAGRRLDGGGGSALHFSMLLWMRRPRRACCRAGGGVSKLSVASTS